MLCSFLHRFWKSFWKVRRSGLRFWFGVRRFWVQSQLGSGLWAAHCSNTPLTLVYICYVHRDGVMLETGRACSVQPREMTVDNYMLTDVTDRRCNSSCTCRAGMLKRVVVKWQLISSWERSRYTQRCMCRVSAVRCFFFFSVPAQSLCRPPQLEWLCPLRHWPPHQRVHPDTQTQLRSEPGSPSSLTFRVIRQILCSALKAELKSKHWPAGIKPAEQKTWDVTG